MNNQYCSGGDNQYIEFFESQNIFRGTSSDGIDSPGLAESNDVSYGLRQTLLDLKNPMF
jgi:hypothetical protein